EALRNPPLARRIVPLHELLRPTLQHAGPCDAQPMRGLGYKNAARCRGHRLRRAGIRETAAVILGAGGDEELRIIGHMEVDRSLELDRAYEVLAAAAQQHLGLAGVCCRLVDCALNG